MSQPLIIAAYSLIFLLSFAVCLFGFIISRRVILDRRKVHFDRVYREIEKDILEAVSRLDPAFTLGVAQKYIHHPAVLTQALLDFGDVIAGEGREQLKIIFSRAIRNRCLRGVASRWATKRLRSVRLFIIFFDPAESDFLFRLLDDKPIIKLAVINALARVPTPETTRYIFRAFEEDSGATVQAYFNIMFGLGNRIEASVRAFLKKPQSPAKLGLLVELVGAIPLRTLYEDITPLAAHPDKEIRIRVARALGKLLVPETADTLIALASDEAWEVKAQAVKSLGQMKNLKALDILEASLFSPSWYVRHNAGYGLADMGEEGLRRLKKVAAQEADRYARDMSVMVLNELIVTAEAA